MVRTSHRTFWGGKGQQPQDDFDATVDYYKILGLTSSASDSDIKNQYYKLCYEYHPDRTGGMYQEKFKQINAAY